MAMLRFWCGMVVFFSAHTLGSSQTTEACTCSDQLPTSIDCTCSRPLTDEVLEQLPTRMNLTRDLGLILRTFYSGFFTGEAADTEAQATFARASHDGDKCCRASTQWHTVSNGAKLTNKRGSFEVVSIADSPLRGQGYREVLSCQLFASCINRRCVIVKYTHTFLVWDDDQEGLLIEKFKVPTHCKCASLPPSASASSPSTSFPKSNCVIRKGGLNHGL